MSKKKSGGLFGWFTGKPGHTTGPPNKSGPPPPKKPPKGKPMGTGR